MKHLIGKQVDVVSWLRMKFKKGHNALILRGEQGVGKTIMALTVADRYEKVLFVTEAGVIKDVKEDLDMCVNKFDLDLNVEFISYNGFANTRKFKVVGYDLIIFDECHKLKHYSTGWTNRMVRLKATEDRQMLFMSGTPFTSSPRDMTYVLLKTNAFKMRAKDFGIKYFGDTKSFKGDFMEKGEKLINKNDFMANYEDVAIDISKKDVDSDIPMVKYSFHKLSESVADMAEDIIDETRVRVGNGLKKVKESCEYIKKEWDGEAALVLCAFHDVANLAAMNLDCRVALTPKDVQEAFQEIKEGKLKMLVTTLGLTKASYNLNECNTVYMIESTYSFSLDQQSQFRCQRIGKRDTLHVTYLYQEGDTTLKKSVERYNLAKQDLSPQHSPMGPSSLAHLEKCPGSYWFEDSRSRDFMAGYSVEGTRHHMQMEYYLDHPEEDIPETLMDNAGNMIIECRDYITKSEKYGIEDKVSAPSLHEDCYGTVDFWCYYKESKTLIVADYKNGSSPVSVNDNFQLGAYTAFICETHDIEPETVIHMIFQREDQKTCVYDNSIVRLSRGRIKRVIKKIEEAKRSPLEHLKEGKCSIFCRAQKEHKLVTRRAKVAEKKAKKKTKKVVKETGGKKKAKKSIKIGEVQIDSAKVFFEGLNKKKTGKNIGVNISEEDYDSILELAKGKAKLEKIIKDRISYSDEYETYSLFATIWAQSDISEFMDEDLLGQELELSVNLAITKPSEAFPKPNLFVSVEDLEIIGDVEEEEEDTVIEEKEESDGGGDDFDFLDGLD